jgi:hypothetical protein
MSHPGKKDRRKENTLRKLGEREFHSQPEEAEWIQKQDDVSKNKEEGSTSTISVDIFTREKRTGELQPLNLMVLLTCTIAKTRKGIAVVTTLALLMRLLVQRLDDQAQVPFRRELRPTRVNLPQVPRKREPLGGQVKQEENPIRLETRQIRQAHLVRQRGHQVPQVRRQIRRDPQGRQGQLDHLEIRLQYRQEGHQTRLEDQTDRISQAR